MKILNATIRNFGSYKSLEFNFDGAGLALISGPTGSGKSTLCDIVPWVIFGVTAKNGSVDDVINWSNKGSTYGTVIVEIAGKLIHIVRQRSPNDLYYSFGPDASLIRGRNISDTQALIDDLLGIDVGTYLTGAYYHEFSPSSQFFSSNAKTRRIITEKLADLSLTNSINERIKEYIKSAETLLSESEADISFSSKCIEQNRKLLDYSVSSKYEWDEKRRQEIEKLEREFKEFSTGNKKNIAALSKSLQDFESDRSAKLARIKSEIEELTISANDAHLIDLEIALRAKKALIKDDICSHCGSPKNSADLLVIEKSLNTIFYDKQKADQCKKTIGILNREIARETNKPNPYSAQLESEKARSAGPYLNYIQEKKTQENPHDEAVARHKKVIEQIQKELEDLNDKKTSIYDDLADLNLLSDMNTYFRSRLVSNVVQHLETCTNRLLSEHFDAEIKVLFSAGDADKIEVDIFKDENICNFAQLSKGQRQILKLCFGVSVMSSIANHNLTSFNCVFFDECIEGLDESMKSKAFKLLDHIRTQYSSVFVVDHSETFKSFFNTRYDVSLINGESTIEAT